MDGRSALPDRARTADGVEVAFVDGLS